MAASPALRVVALSGGVGGARLADGLSRVIAPDDLLVVANTADDFEHLGLSICPDLDTVMYTLADRANPATGWGLEDESWHCMTAMSALGGPDWFRLGDRDLATHLYRSNALAEGRSLSQVTASLCEAFGVAAKLLPMSDQRVRTRVDTAAGEMSFQHYFVRDACEPSVTGFRFDGVEVAQPAAGIAQFCRAARVDAVILCPSNPYVSIDPILAIPGMQNLLRSLDCPIVAVSPIIGGKAVKGPAAKMMAELGVSVSSEGIARHYRGFVDHLFLDTTDSELEKTIRGLGMEVTVCRTLMRDAAARQALAESVLTSVAGKA